MGLSVFCFSVNEMESSLKRYSLTFRYNNDVRGTTRLLVKATISTVTHGVANKINYWKSISTPCDRNWRHIITHIWMAKRVFVYTRTAIRKWSWWSSWCQWTITWSRFFIFRLLNFTPKAAFMLASLTTFFFSFLMVQLALRMESSRKKLLISMPFVCGFPLIRNSKRFRLLIEWNHLANKSRTENSRGGKKRARQTKTNLGISAALFFFRCSKVIDRLTWVS